jgi:hypothetical protein
MGYDYGGLRKAILDCVERKELELVEQTDTDITCISYDEDIDGKETSYHLAQPDKQWIRSRFLWGPSCESDRTMWEDIMADVLSELPPQYLVVLNRIVVVRTEEDIAFVCNEMDVEEYEFPDTITLSDALGCLWWSQNSVVLDFAAIQKSLEEEEREYGYTDFWDEHAGIIVTLLHELRHLRLDCFDFYDDDPDGDDSECGYPVNGQERCVEMWARDEYEKMFG